MHFLGILVKSDLLKQTEAIKNANGKYDTLFDANNNNGMLDISAIFNRSGMVEEMIEDFRLFGDYDLDKIQTTVKEIWESQNIKADVRTLKVEERGAIVF